MPDYKLSFILEAENKCKVAIDQVKNQLEGVQGKLKDMEPAFKKLAAVGIAGFAAVTGEVILAIKAAAESEKAWALVTHQIKLAGLDIDSTTKSTQTFASEIQRLTGYSDEYIGMLVGRFLPSVKDLNEAKKMAKIALDMEASGMVNAETAAKALMAAYEGDIMMLKRYVPDLRGLDDEVLKNMSSTEKYQLAMETLEGQFGGLAEAAGKTAAGQLNILKETFGDLQEKIGERLIPILKSLIDKMMPIIENVMKWIEENPKLTVIIIAATAAISGLVAVIGLLGMALPGIIIMFTKLSAVSLPITGTILAIIVVIGLLIKIGWDLYHHWDEIIKGFKIMFEEWKTKVMEIWNKIRDFFSDIWEDIKTIFDRAINWLMAKIQPFIDAFEKVKSGVSWLGSKVGGAWEKLFGGGQFGIPMVPRTGMYMLHRGERITPAGAGMGGGITVQILGGTYLSETVAEEIGDLIIEKLKRNYRI